MRICFLAQNLTAQLPARQLLDRFLIGYPRDGAFHKPATEEVCLHTPDNSPETTAALQQRERDFGLKRTGEEMAAFRHADGIVVLPRDEGARASQALVTRALHLASPGTRCFIYGPLAPSLNEAMESTRLAADRNVTLCAGTALPVTWRLPEVDIEQDTPLREALIVVQGNFRMALLEGLEGILPLTEKRAGGQGTVRAIRALEGREFWSAARAELWSRTLFAAALSRSNSPLGDPEKDGRTQDLVGLGLVPKLARFPRAWVIDFDDGFRTTVLQLNGVVGDCNFAVGKQDGGIVSAQLFRPPAPARHEFSRLAAVLERFFSEGTPPWPLQRSQLIADLMRRFTDAAGF